MVITPGGSKLCAEYKATNSGSQGAVYLSGPHFC